MSAIPADSTQCPRCGVPDLHVAGLGRAYCPQCGLVMDGRILKTLMEIRALPIALGAHACECDHPWTRRLPDGVYRCPACGSEVLPISGGAAHKRSP